MYIILYKHMYYTDVGRIRRNAYFYIYRKANKSTLHCTGSSWAVGAYTGIFPSRCMYRHLPPSAAAVSVSTRISAFGGGAGGCCGEGASLQFPSNRISDIALRTNSIESQHSSLVASNSIFRLTEKLLHSPLILLRSLINFPPYAAADGCTN